MSDYAGFETEATPADLQVLMGLAAQQQELEVEIAAAEESVKELKKRLATISEFKLPEVMERLGMKEFTLKNGDSLKLDEKLRVKVPAKNKTEAYTWVEEHGGSAIVKRAFVIAFSKEQEKFARKFARDCAQRKNALPMEETRAVESSSLGKFLRDQRALGVDVPLPLFGAFNQKFVKATRKK